MKKYKVVNIIFISLAILTILISFIYALSVDGNGSMKAFFTSILLVSFALLIFALVMVALLKKKTIMIPMLILFLNAFFSSKMLSYVLSSMTEQQGASSEINALEFLVIILAILGIVFTCLKHKWGAVVGIVGVGYMIFSQNGINCVMTTLAMEQPEFHIFAWTSAAVLFQFVWLIIPMIFLLCEKTQEEKTPQVEEQVEGE